MTVLPLAAVPPLTPVEATLTEMRRRRGGDVTRGLVPGLILPDGLPDWTPASALVSGEQLEKLLDVASRRWRGSPHANAALTWNSYTHWLSLPAVVGWATARRVPLLHPDDVMVRISDRPPLVTFGLRRLRVAVLRSDPLASTTDDDVTVVSSEAALLTRLRTTLRDEHLDPLMAQIRSRARLGERALLGSLASAVAYSVIRGVPEEVGDAQEILDPLLSALGVTDLVELAPGPDGYTVQRRTCCLAFTLPQPKVCSGCCLRQS